MVGPYARRQLLGAVLVALGTSAGCRDAAPPVLPEIREVSELQAQFNAGAGKPRVVLLLSPT